MMLKDDCRMKGSEIFTGEELRRRIMVLSKVHKNEIIANCVYFLRCSEFENFFLSSSPYERECVADKLFVAFVDDKLNI